MQRIYCEWIFGMKTARNIDVAAIKLKKHVQIY